jgi:hypothetical protein
VPSAPWQVPPLPIPARAPPPGRKTSGDRAARREAKRSACGQGQRRATSRRLRTGKKELKIQDWLFGLLGHRVWEGKQLGGRVRSLAWVLVGTPPPRQP